VGVSCCITEIVSEKNHSYVEGYMSHFKIYYGRLLCSLFIIKAYCRPIYVEEWLIFYKSDVKKIRYAYEYC